QPLTISTTAIGDFPAGSNRTFEVAAFGGLPPYTFEFDSSSTLPAGAFILQTADSGSPTSNPNRGLLAAEVLTSGPHNFVLRVTDSAGNRATRPIPWRVS